MTDLKDLKELANNATPGPWTARKEQFEDESFPRQYVYHEDQPDSEMPVAFPVGGTKEGDNAAFIAAANPKTVLELIARVEELEGDIEFFKNAQKCSGEIEHDLRTALEQAKAREAELSAFAEMVRDLPIKNENMPHGVWLDGEKKTGPLADWFCGEFLPKLKQAAVTSMGGDDD